MSPGLDAPPAGAARRVARDLDELKLDSSVYDDLHVEARRVLDRNPEPRNLRDVAVALESMGYTTSAAQELGFQSVFDLAGAVYDLTYLYYVPLPRPVVDHRGSWRRFADDYLSGSWYGVPWIMAVLVLFFGRVALWSSLDASPQVAAMVSLAFFVAAILAGGCSQMLGRKGTFYFLQKNFPLVRWTATRFLTYGATAALLVIAVVYSVYIVPHYGLRLGEVFAEFAVAIFVFLLSAAPLYMLRRFYTLALATGLALVVTLATARLFSGSSPGLRHAQLLGLAVGSGAMVVIAASYLAVRGETDPGGRDSLIVVKPPELRVVLWHSAQYALYGFAYFVMILIGPLIVGFAYGRSLGIDQYVYPSTYEGSVDLALLELVLVLGLVYASIERFGRRLVPLLENQRLDHWPQARTALRREWTVSILTVAGFSAFGGVGPAEHSPAPPAGNADLLGPFPWRNDRVAGDLARIRAGTGRDAWQSVPLLPRTAALAGDCRVVRRGGQCRRNCAAGQWWELDTRSLGLPCRCPALLPRRRTRVVPGIGRRRGVVLCLVLSRTRISG